MTRAFISLCRLNIKDAFSIHPGIFLMPLFFLYFWQNGAVFKNKILNRTLIILAAVLFFAHYMHRLIIYGG